LLEIWDSIVKHRFAPPFRYPVTDEEAPDYDEIITNRMDLETIKTQIENGTISTPEQIWDAFSLMYDNARTYNGEDTDLYVMAAALETYTRNRISKVFTSFLPPGQSKPKVAVLPMPVKGRPTRRKR